MLGQHSLCGLFRMHGVSQTREHDHELIAAQTCDLPLDAIYADLVDYAL
jgi:hypothetical protein